MSTPVKWHHKFLVNTTTANAQFYPSITGLADGRFVVAWTDYSLSHGDPKSAAIRAQMFNADGSLSGAEFLVNSTTKGAQSFQSITALADGRFVVAWGDTSRTGGDTSWDAVRAQVFNADGSPSGAEFLVNSTNYLSQYFPVVTALADSRFVVAWTDTSQTGFDITVEEIRAQVFNADGSPSGAEFLVNSTTRSSLDRPCITALADGRFVVAWTDASTSGGDTSAFGIRARVFNADGSPSGAEFLVNTTTPGDQFQPSITGLADGRFVVAWTDTSHTGGDTSDFAVRAQVFNADGSQSGAEFLVNSTTEFYQVLPCITALADGRFVVVWNDNSRTNGDNFGYAVVGQLFNSDGSKSGTEFLISPTTSSTLLPDSVTALADGRFVVTWTDEGATGGDTSGFAVHAQIFDPREAAVNLTGSKLSDDFVGTIFDDTMRGQGGADHLVGSQGNDALSGDAGNDVLEGRSGNDTLSGGVGNDTLLGGHGIDLLSGGSGADVFVFTKGGVHDVITDFQNGKDAIDLTAFAFADFASAKVHFFTAGGDMVFAIGSVTLLIENFTLAQLTAADLIL